MVAAILAVLKCGAVYVPLDGRIATDSIVDHVLRDSGAKAVISSKFCLSRVSSRADVTVVCMEALFETSPAPFSHRRRGKITSLNSGSGAYIIYTSGMTTFVLPGRALKLTSRYRNNRETQGCAGHAQQPHQLYVNSS